MHCVFSNTPESRWIHYPLVANEQHTLNYGSIIGVSISHFKRILLWPSMIMIIHIVNVGQNICVRYVCVVFFVIANSEMYPNNKNARHVSHINDVSSISLYSHFERWNVCVHAFSCLSNGSVRVVCLCVSAKNMMSVWWFAHCLQNKRCMMLTLLIFGYRLNSQYFWMNSMNIEMKECML